MTLALSIFLLVLFAELIQWIGQSVLFELAYSIHLRIFYASKVAQQRALKNEILTAKAELLQTSSQDQFAKWAKLRRRVDKGLAELEQLNGELGSARNAYKLKFNTFIWLLTTGVQFVIGWWYRKSAVFYLPPGWLGPATWFLSLPFAPSGSVSCGAWQMACRRVIKVGERTVRDLTVTSIPTEQEGEKAKKEQ
ncbi:GET1 [Sanghuangporus vaninii]